MWRLLASAAFFSIQDVQRDAPGPYATLAGGEYAFEATAQDDSVPLPVGATYAAGADGDREIAPASGDPFFLGFAAGAYFPPEDELVDPELTAQLQTVWRDGRATQESYAFVMFAKRITPERVAELERLGARVLGFHPHYCMKLALAPGVAEELAALDFVRWVGVPKRWQRVHPALALAFEREPAGRAVNAWIDVYDGDLCADSTARVVGAAGYGGPEGEFERADGAELPRAWMSNGWQQRALEELGVEVREYVDELRAFRVRLLPGAVELVTALDFVQFVEPEPAPRLFHDESMPLINADRTRAAYDAGSVAIAGQVDSGIEYSHQGLGSFAWWQNNYTPEPSTDDSCGHGSHVAGTLHGDGDVDDSYEGVADGLGWGATGRFFNVKHFSGVSCLASSASLPTIMAGLHSAVTDGNGNVTPRPHVINHSWGTSDLPDGWIGSEAECREIDAETYTYGQLHIWAAGNMGPHESSLSLHASAKNGFAVGAVADYYANPGDPGRYWLGSSFGPCGDDRWKPNVCAPGSRIYSANAADLDGYANRNGTSMAAPHVTGLAAQLVEHFAFLRYNPSTLGAVLMATALTKDDQLLTTPSTDFTHHLNTYGTGRVEALKAHGMLGDAALSFWGWTQGTSGVVYVDLNVLVGADRLAVCLFYNEPACSAGASQALVNDLDLYLDSPPITAGATGEFVAQQSIRDNVEIRILDNPEVGTWRIKVDSDAATSNSYVGVCAIVMYGDTQPAGTLTVSASDTTVRPFDDVAITASAFNPSYVASAVYLDSTSSGDILQSVTTTLEDNATTDLSNNAQFGRDVLLGNIDRSDTRAATWVTYWGTEGVKTFEVEARSDNWVDRTDSVSITVDGTPPPVPTSLQSTTHTPGIWSANPNVDFVWTQPADNLSGIAGYSWTLDTVGGLPDATQDLGAVTSFSLTLPAPGGSYAFNLRPVDACGNWNGGKSSAGFYKFDPVSPNPPTALASTTHTPSVASCDTVANVTWSAATDAHSGIGGYLGVWNTSASFDPVGATTILPGNTSYSADIGSSASPRWFHLRAKDVAGNYSTTQHFGPVLANASSVSTYCTAKTNSLACAPQIFPNGAHPSIGAGNFTVLCSNVINQKNGLLFWGSAASATPFQGGVKCVAAPTMRTPVVGSGGSPSTANDCSGLYTFNFTTAYCAANALQPGDTLYAQWWMRDPASPSTTGLSNGLTFTLCE